MKGSLFETQAHPASDQRRERERKKPAAKAEKKIENRQRNEICLLNYATGDLLAIISASSNFVRQHSSHSQCRRLTRAWIQFFFFVSRKFAFCHLRICAAAQRVQFEITNRNNKKKMVRICIDNLDSGNLFKWRGRSEPRHTLVCRTEEI